MKEDNNDTKVYARSNFDLNKVIHTTTNPKIFNRDSNNLTHKPESLNYIMDDNDSNPSQNNEEGEEDHDNSHAAQH